jgi:FkbM family methyltransferase
MGSIAYLKLNVNGFFVYRRTYRNYVRLIIHIIRKKYPIQVILRDKTNHTITLRNHLETNYYTSILLHKEIEYNALENSITISSPSNTTEGKSKIKLYGAVNNGDSLSIFTDKIYEYLPVKGNTVIDIGANIADSSIYFALSGARKVIGIEPFPANYRLAKKNVETNNLSNKIKMILAGCGANPGYITVDPDFQSIAESTIDFKEGVKVPLITLENILDDNDILSSNDKTVLKMDCEGCEYDVILSCTEKTLRRISYIQIEYHFGYKNLKEKLEKCGFTVSFSRPLRLPNNRNAFKMTDSGPRHQYIGYIKAKRN